MRWKIKSGVGVRQPNRKDDVKKIQMLLNRSTDEKTPQLLLKEDGFFGPKTKYRIEIFQRTQLHIIKIDGIVDPRGPTQRRLRNARIKKTIHNKRHKALSPHTKTAVMQSKNAILPGDSSLKNLEKKSILNAKKKAWIDRALPAAINVKARWGVPISVTLAQGALESDWGLKAPINVYFGVKGLSPKGKSVSISTHEVYNGRSTAIKDSFRAYDTLEQSADDYGNFLVSNHRYAKAFNFKNDPESFVQEIANAGYATDPKYKDKIVGTMRANGLCDYDLQHP